MSHPVYRREEAPHAVGEGLTRTSSPAAQLWPVVVVMPGLRPMRSTVLATSQAEALRFAQNRHPQAIRVEAA